MIETWLLTKQDVEGFFVDIAVSSGGFEGRRQVRVDRYGYLLWQEYKWNITYQNWFAHRFEDGKLIAFHRQLLNLHGSSEVVRFDNGNMLDCRIINLNTRSKDWVIDPLYLAELVINPRIPNKVGTML